MAWSAVALPHDAVVKCGHDDVAHIEFTSPGDQGPQPVGAALFLDLPSSLPSLCAVYYRQHIIPPFNARTYPTLIASSSSCSAR